MPANQLVKVFMVQKTGESFNTSAAKMNGKILTLINIVISVTFNSIWNTNKLNRIADQCL